MRYQSKFMSKNLYIFSAILILFLISLIGPSQESNAGTWTPIGPGGGNIKAVVLSPNYAADQTIFVGIEGSGIFKSTNNGTNWIAVNTGLTDLNVYALAISPSYSTDQTIFVVTYGGGVFKSTNGGANWSAVNTGLSNLYVRSIAISPNYATDQTVFVGSYYRVFKTTDGGMTWNLSGTGINYCCVTSFAISPNYAVDRTIFAGANAGNYGEIYKSTNGGQSWSVVYTSLAGSNVLSLAISPNYAVDQTIFRGMWNEGVFKSTNGGTSWSAVNTGLSNLTVFSLASSPNYATSRTLFAGTGGGVFKSTNGGTGWSAINTGLSNMTVSSIAVFPNYATVQTLFAGTSGGGVYKSMNGGTSWSAINTGLNTLNTTSVAISPNYTVDQTFFVGTSAISGGIFKSIDGGVNWTIANAGLTHNVSSIAISPNYSTDQTLFAGTNGGVYKSTDGGLNWSVVYTSNSLYTLAISPNYAVDQTIFAGVSGGVYKSTDGGLNWSTINAGFGSTIYVYVLAISPNYALDQTLFAGTDGGVYKSTNGGASWSVVTVSGYGVSTLSISPNYEIDQTIFAGMSGVIHKSTNGGMNWTAASYGISYVQKLAISPYYAVDQTIFAGTNGGIYKSTNAGVSWNAVNSGLSSLIVSTLAVSPGYPCDGTLFAGIAASSVWKYTDTEAIALCIPSEYSIHGVVTKGGAGLDGVALTLNDVSSTTITSALDGSYTFTDIQNGNYTITPRLTGYTFSPTSISVSVSEADVTGVDFVATPVNNAPILDPIGAKSVNEGALLRLSVSGSDLDSDPLTFSASNLPAGASFDPDTQVFSWTPDFTQSGLYSITCMVSDGSLNDSEVVPITVNNVNRAPVLDSIGDQYVSEGNNPDIFISASDPDGGVLILSVAGLPGFCEFSDSGNNTAILSCNSGYGDAGAYGGIIFSASDGSLTDSETISLTVNNVNQPPILNPIGSKVVNEGELLTFTVSGSDLDGDPVIFGAQNVPFGATFDPLTRIFFWTPDYEDAGVYQVTFTLDDVVNALSTSQTIAITVNQGDAFVTSDLSGNWNFHLVTSGDSSQMPGWSYGSMLIDNSGNFSATFINRSNGDSSNLPQGTFSIAQDGTVSMVKNNTSFHGVITVDNSMIIGTMTDGGGGFDLIIFQRSGGSFMQGDLAGNWYVHQLTSGDSQQWIGAAHWDMSIDSNGNFSFANYLNSSGDTSQSSTTGAMNIDSNGIVIVPGNTSFHAVMSQDKNMIVGTMNDGGGGYDIFIYQRGDSLFSPTNLAGRWNIHELHSSYSPLINAWAYGTSEINQNGDYSTSLLFSYDKNEAWSSVYSIDVNEVISDQSNLTSHGTIGLGRDIIVYTYWWSGSEYALGVMNRAHTFIPVNQPPVLNAIGSKAINESALLAFTVSGSDPDGDVLTYSASNLPDGAGFDPISQTFSWTPTYDQSGLHSIMFAVSDGSLSASETVAIMVNNVNRAPVLDEIGDGVVDEGGMLDWSMPSFDPDGDLLILAVEGLPGFCTFTDNRDNTSTLRCSPGYSDSGVYSNIVFTASDGSLADSETITLTVNNVNRAPNLNPISDQIVDEGSSLNLTITANDPDGDTVALSVSGLPAFCDVFGTIGDWGMNFGTELFVTCTPGYDDAGIYPGITITADDGSLTDNEMITLTVRNINRAPVLASIGARSVSEGSMLSFTVDGNDPDGDSLTFGVTGLPAGAIFEPETKTFSYTPDYDTSSQAQDSFFDVFFSVSDGLLTDSENVIITVSNVNRAPVLSSIGAKSADEGTQINFTINGSDPDGDPLTFSVSGLPSGAGFDPSSWTFSWIPGYTQAGDYNVAFSLSDGISSDSEEVLITVNNVNLSPALNHIGNQAVNEGSSLNLTVIAGDHDGDLLTFSASELPSFCSFVAHHNYTGTFECSPDYIDSGTYTGITFTVSDGVLSDSETLTLTVNDMNGAPAVDAGADRIVLAGSSVTLNGKGSDPEGEQVILSWLQTTGPLVNLNDSNSASPAFIAPAVNQGGEILTFELTVSDGVYSSTDTVNITIVNDADLQYLPIKITDAIPSDSITQGSTFFTSEIFLDFRGGPIRLASDIQGTEVISVDDVLSLSVIHDDGTSSAFNYDYSPGCSGVTTAAPVDLSSYFKPGINHVIVELKDDCGVFAGSTELWLTPYEGVVELTAEAGPDRTADEGERLEFDGSGSADIPGRTILKYLWDFGDGTQAEGINVHHAYGDNGNYTVTLVVADDRGYVGKDTTAITILNVAPTVKIDAPSSVVLGPDHYSIYHDQQPLTFTASVSEPGVNDRPVLHYEWNFGDGGPVSNQTSPVKFYTVSESEVSKTFLITLTVQDDDGGSDSDSIQLTVRRNQIPQIDQIVFDPQIIYENTTPVMFSALITDDGTINTYKWLFGDGSNDSPDSSPTHVFANNAIGGQSYVVSLMAIDDGGLPVYKETYVSVLNLPPTASITADRTTVPILTPVTLTGSASDPAGMGDVPFTYQWNFGDGLESGSSESRLTNSVVHEYAQPGSYTVNLAVTDRDSGIGNAEPLTIDVCPPGENPVSIIREISGSFVEGGLVRFDGSLSYDPEGCPGKATWTFGDGETADGLNATHRYANEGTYIVTLTMTDAYNNESTTSSTVTIENSCPSIRLANGITGNINKSVTLSGSVYDPGIEDNLHFVWDFGDGSSQVSGTDISEVTHSYGAVGSYDVTLTVSDGLCETSGSSVVTISDPQNVDISINPGVMTLGLEESGTYSIKLKNNTRYEGVVRLDVEAPSGIGASFEGYSGTSISVLMSAGEVRTIQLRIAVPCTPTFVGNYNITITGGFSSSQLSIPLNAAASLSVVDRLTISHLIPEDDRTFSTGEGSASVMVSWRTAVDSSTEVLYRGDGQYEFTSVTGTPGRDHRVILSNLPTGTYRWKVRSTGSCSEVTGPERVFRVSEKGVTFAKKVYEFNVDRNYDIHLPIAVRNHDLSNHYINPDVMNNREGIPANFIPETDILIQSGEHDIDLVVHPVGEARTHVLTIKLSAYDGQEAQSSIINNDYAQVVLHLPPCNLDIERLSYDAETNAGNYRVTNVGDSNIPDLQIFAEDGIAPYILMDPAISHWNLGQGESLYFSAIFMAPSDTLLTDSGMIYASSSNGGCMAEAPAPDPPQWSSHNIPVPSSHLCLDGQNWYCTNEGVKKDKIEIPFSLPPGFSTDDLNKATFYVTFDLPLPHTSYEPHDIVFSVNDKQFGMLENAIPEGSYSFDIPVQLLNTSGTGIAKNLVSMEIRDFNEALYLVANNFKLILDLKQMSLPVSAPTYEDALAMKDRIVSAMPFCDGDPGVSLLPRFSSVKIHDSWGFEKDSFKNGETVYVKATVRNQDINAHYPFVHIDIDSDPADQNTTAYSDSRMIAINPGEAVDVLFEWNNITANVPPGRYHVSLRLTEDFAGEVCYDCPGYNWSFDVVIPKNPLIIVPGFMGSYLDGGLDVALGSCPLTKDPLVNFIFEYALSKWTLGIANKATIDELTGTSKEVWLRFMKMVCEINDEHLDVLQSDETGLAMDLSIHPRENQLPFVIHPMSAATSVLSRKIAGSLASSIIGSALGKIPLSLLQEGGDIKILTDEISGLIAKKIYGPPLEMAVDNLNNLLRGLGLYLDMDASWFAGFGYGRLESEFRDRDVYKFAYDWRKGFEEIGAQFNEYVTGLSSPTGKFDIVAHSNGGLVVKAYILQNGEARDSIDKLIMIGTPHLGVPEAFQALRYGDDVIDIEIPYPDWRFKPLNHRQVRKIARNWLQLYETLPDQGYFDRVPYYFINGINGPLDYTRMKEFLMTSDIYDPLFGYNIARPLNSNLIDAADSSYIHTDLSRGLQPEDTYVIAGSGKPTKAVYVEFKKKPEITGDCAYVVMRNGDGTVPIESAAGIIPKQIYYVKGEHRRLTLYDSVLNQVKGLLGGEEVPVSGISLNRYPLGKYTVATLFGPGEIHMYDVYDGRRGNHVGGVLGSIIEVGIPGADYEKYGNCENTVLTERGQYEYEVIGREEGSVMLRLDIYQDDLIERSALFTDVPVTGNSVLKLGYDTENPVFTLKIDNDGDGIFESERPASSILEGDDTVTHPVISAVDVSQVTNNSAIITWNTDELAGSVVDYGEPASYGLTAVDNALTTAHAISLSGLHGGTTYHVLIRSRDVFGNESVSEDLTFTTLNNLPVAVDDTMSVREGTSVAFRVSDLLSNDTDADGDTLTVTGVLSTAETHGTVALLDGTVTYIPDTDYIGPANFAYSVEDGHGGVATGMVLVSVYSQRLASSNGSSSYFSEGGYNAYATFDVRYQTGAVVPSGSLAFTSSRYRRKIVSTGIDALTVSANTAIVSGPCTMNGVSGYYFTATAADNATPGARMDTFSIRVTGPNGFSYTASGTIISGDYTVSR